MVKRFFVTLPTASLLVIGLAAQSGTALAGGHGQSGYTCVNQNHQGVQVGQVCIGQVGPITVNPDVYAPVTVTVGDVNVLNDNQLTVLSNDLNNITIQNNDIQTYVQNIKVKVLSDFHDVYGINITDNVVSVCCTPPNSTPVCSR
jgi:hypothetical protein